MLFWRIKDTFYICLQSKSSTLLVYELVMISHGNDNLPSLATTTRIMPIMSTTRSLVVFSSKAIIIVVVVYYSVRYPYSVWWYIGPEARTYILDRLRSLLQPSWWSFDDEDDVVTTIWHCLIGGQYKCNDMAPGSWTEVPILDAPLACVLAVLHPILW